MRGDRTAERHQALWIVPGPLVIWAAHFLATYVTAALWCGRVGGATQPPRLAIAIYTVVALLGIAAIAWIAYGAHRYGEARSPHDADSPEDRYRFIGYAAWLIAGLSVVAVIYSAMAAAVIGTCH